MNEPAAIEIPGTRETPPTRFCIVFRHIFGQVLDIIVAVQKFCRDENIFLEKLVGYIEELLSFFRIMLKE